LNQNTDAKLFVRQIYNVLPHLHKDPYWWQAIILGKLLWHKQCPVQDNNAAFQICDKKLISLVIIKGWLKIPLPPF
jgi:hypothetical protein